jgi:uncharacterized protein YbjT (DUF2867 family)
MYGIIGASGVLGQRIVQRLLDRDVPLRLFTREPSKLEGLAGRTDIRRADLRGGDWDGALEGVDTLVLAAHGLVPPVRANNPRLTDDQGQRHVIDAARRAGVRKIAFVSAEQADPGSSVEFMRIKAGLEARVRQGGADYIIVRPTAFMETHAILVMAEPLRSGGRVQLFGPGTTPFNWVSAGDVADYLVSHLLDGDAARQAEATIGGPDTLSRVEVLDRIARRLGVSAEPKHVPLTMVRLIGATAGRLNPALGCLIQLTLAEHAGDARTRRPYDWTGPTTLDQVLARWMADLAGATAQPA